MAQKALVVGLAFALSPLRPRVEIPVCRPIATFSTLDTPRVYPRAPAVAGEPVTICIEIRPLFGRGVEV
jgi:hypothetical protein